MIRKAIEDDILSIAHLGRAFVEAAWEGVAEYNVMNTIEWLEEFILLPHTALFVAEVEGEIVGMIAGIVFPFYFNKSHLNAQELFWWVSPPNRKSRVGIDLLKAFEEWAVKKGAKTIQMGTVAKINPEKLAAVYKKKGYQESETYWTKVL